MKSLSNRQLLSTSSVDSYKDCPCPDFCISWIWSFHKWFRYALLHKQLATNSLVANSFETCGLKETRGLSFKSPISNWCDFSLPMRALSTFGLNGTINHFCCLPIWKRRSIPVHGAIRMQKLWSQHDRMSQWDSKKEILFCCTFNTMVSFSKLSCRCQGQCLVAKVA